MVAEEKQIGSRGRMAATEAKHVARRRRSFHVAAAALAPSTSSSKGAWSPNVASAKE